MKELTDQIKTLAEGHLKDDSYFIVDVISKGVSGKTKILVLLDGDQGVTIDDCAELSRNLAEDIELEDLIDVAYVLEVSSPGLDHPLASLRQFRKNVGRKLRVRLKSGSQIEGNLQVVNEAAIVLAAESKEKKKKVVEEKEISFADIEKANVLVSFK
ncbi:ribosome maturation factor RimP [Roseivirga thermotolerans]|jgi:ribosome maturation factor RimP|uniref:ribosome maturation factor RimP n=1 Tax=Roseivirga thermotolerans TaxID=1758176 RepID=UPI00273E7249|nr:ribosome maturation factor RimP [Roseivirga thermotolerans]MEC7752872.1 ribosome maturation factor RimP [Bacteroidota bacterium]